jgi:glycosyltransferase involved in cell wall biosynthesis
VRDWRSNAIVGISPVRVLLVHNRYQVPGGEDTVVRQEEMMLRDAGVSVELLEANNDGLVTLSQRVGTALMAPYSIPGRRRVAERVRTFRPDVVHVHNFFPALSPSVYDACADQQVPVVQTLHNYRLMCANGMLFREGTVCTECLGHKLPWPSIQHGCYRGSRLGSLTVASMIALHRLRKTWSERVQCFIALTGFARDLFIQEVNIPAEQIVVKPNAVDDLGVGDHRGGYALFIGRLSPEKGLDVLLRAATEGDGLGIPLKIAGAGPLQGAVQAASASGKTKQRVEFLGPVNREGVGRLMQQARVLLLPSLWYEGLPMVIPEAFSTGLPVIASRIGALGALIEDGYNGLLTEPGDERDLASIVQRLVSNSAVEVGLRSGARETYLARYHPKKNADILLEIYHQLSQTKQPARSVN